MSAVDLLASALVTLFVHATVLLGAVWIAERAGALRHRGWAELAWRAALLGALLTTGVQVARWWPTPAAPSTATTPLSPITPPGGAGPSPAEPASTMTEAAPPAARSAAPARDVLADAPGTGTGSASRAALELRGTAALALLGGWALALAIGGLRFGRQALAIARLARHSRRHGAPAPATLHRDAEAAAARFAVAPPSLHLLEGVGSPMLLPGRRLLLPAWVPSLSTPQRHALLAHEIAHLQRHDPAWRVLQRVAALPLCFHPLVWHALDRLDAIAEDDCDARAARLAGSGRPLAECLAACLAHATRPAPVLAVAMADRPGPVVRRVRNLLEKDAMSDRPVSPLLRRSALALGLAAALVIPGIAVTTVAAGAGDGLLSRITGEGRQNLSFTSESGDDRIEMEIDGEVAFDDAESDIVRLGPGASFELAVEKDGDEREVRIWNEDGTIAREYRVDGDVVPFDAGARAWLATQLPTILRETAVNAEARGQRILAKGGTPALLDEIAKIRSDYARGRYLAVLFEHATLDDAQIARALAIAKAIDSDFELGRALQIAAGLPDFPRAHLATLMDAALGIESDFEMGRLLTTVAESHPLDATLLPAWRQALARVGSDFERGRVLRALLERGTRVPGLVVIALESADGLGSDYERGRVLQAAAPHIRGDAAALDAWFAAAAGIGSDHEMRGALQAAMAAGPIDVRFADKVLGVAGRMGSDYEVGEVLGHLAARMPDDAALRERYRAVARGLGDFERGQAEQALDRFAGA